MCDGHDDCGDRMDEKHCSAQSLGYEIKLSGSHFKNEGRIEIKGIRIILTKNVYTKNCETFIYAFRYIKKNK